MRDGVLHGGMSYLCSGGEGRPSLCEASWTEPSGGWGWRVRGPSGKSPISILFLKDKLLTFFTSEVTHTIIALCVCVLGVLNVLFCQKSPFDIANLFFLESSYSISSFLKTLAA